jgi:hypothetical protein
MSNPQGTPEQEQENGAKEKDSSKALNPIGAKEQQESSYKHAYAKCKKYFKGPWWFQEKDAVARFTGWLAVYTGVLVIVSALQFCTLNNTDKTLRDTLEASDASNRAFVFPKSVRFERNIENSQNNWRFSIEWENSGNTPPVDLRLFIYCGPSQIDESPPFAQKYAIKIGAATSILGPKQARVTGRCPVDLETPLGSFIKRDVFLYAGGQALYSDVFGSAHVTQFCFEYEGYGKPLPDIQNGDAREILGDPLLCHSHNCADEECSKHQ